MISKKENFIWLLLSFMIGIISSVFLAPYLIFHMNDPNIYRLDTAEHYFGWLFYKNSPWMWPPTLTTFISYPTAISTVYTDGYPILTIMLKCIRNFLPLTFSFHGVSIIINLSLMFFVSSKLFLKITNDKIFSFLVGLFFIISTPYLFRMQYHSVLSNQWLIVLVLFPYFVDLTHPRKIFSVVIFFAFGIHAYLAAMCILIIIFYYIKFPNSSTKCNKI